MDWYMQSPSDWTQLEITHCDKWYDSHLRDFQAGTVTAEDFKSRFTTGASARSIRGHLDAGAHIIYIARETLVKKPLWLADATFAKFHARYLTPLSDGAYRAYTLPGEDKPGVEVFRGAEQIWAGALHVMNTKPLPQATDGLRWDYQVVLMTPLEMYNIMSALYSAAPCQRGWHPLKGISTERLNVQKLQGQSLPDVMWEAVRIGCHEISALDFAVLYPQKPKLRYLMLHLIIEYIDSEMCDPEGRPISTTNKIYGFLGVDNRTPYRRHRGNRFRISNQERFEEIVNELGGLGEFGPPIHTKNYHSVNRYYDRIEDFSMPFPRVKGTSGDTDGTENKGGNADGTVCKDAGQGQSQRRGLRKRKRV